MLVEKSINFNGREIIQRAKVLSEVAADFSSEKTHYLVEFVRENITFKGLWAKKLVKVIQN